MEWQSSLLLQSSTAGPQGSANVFNYVTKFFLESSPYWEIMANHAKSIWKRIFLQSRLRAHTSESFKHEKHMPKALVICFTVALTTQLWDMKTTSPPNPSCSCYSSEESPNFWGMCMIRIHFTLQLETPYLNILPHPGLTQKKAFMLWMNTF